MSSGGSSAPTSTTVTQTNLPSYVQPYFENILQRAQAQSYQPYVPFGYQLQQGAPSSSTTPQAYNIPGAQGVAGYGGLQSWSQQQPQAPTTTTAPTSTSTPSPTQPSTTPTSGLGAISPNVNISAGTDGSYGGVSATGTDTSTGTGAPGDYSVVPMQGINPTTGLPYGSRLAPFSDLQLQVQQQTAGLQQPSEFGQAQAGLQAAQAADYAAGNYTPGTFQAQQVNAPQLTQYQMGQPSSVSAQQYNAPQMVSAQTLYSPDLQQYQMGAPQTFGSAQAQQYMSPYIQNVLDVQKQQAIRDAQQGQLAQNLAAARQGTYGGARQLLATTERERNLGTQLANIEATGLQGAYQTAQQQFSADRAAQMAAQQANQQAALGVQQLGTQTGLQAALANLSAAQQSQVANQSAILQTQGLNAQQALQAALANQQAGLSAGQTNLQALLGVQQLGTQTGLQAALANQSTGLQAQQLAEQSRQFGANIGLQGAAQAAQASQALGALGTQQQQADLARLQAQSLVGGQQQAGLQSLLDQQYQDYLTQLNYPQQQLAQLSDIIHGLPVQMGTTSTTTAPAPSTLSQISGLGLGALGLSKLMG